MRTLVFAAALLLSLEAYAAEKKPISAGAAQDASSTQHAFDDVLVQGKYHFSDEAVTTVEEDKVLDSLIGVRTDFKDRLEQSAERY